MEKTKCRRAWVLAALAFDVLVIGWLIYFGFYFGAVIIFIVESMVLARIEVE